MNSLIEQFRALLAKEYVNGYKVYTTAEGIMEAAISLATPYCEKLEAENAALREAAREMVAAHKRFNDAYISGARLNGERLKNAISDMAVARANLDMKTEALTGTSGEV